MTLNAPSVNVPVLSNSTISIVLAASRASRCFTRKPLRAALVVDMDATRGTASPNACGQAITRTATRRATANAISAPAASQATSVIVPPTTAITVK